MKKLLLIISLNLLVQTCFGWGFYAHKLINRKAINLLPAGLQMFYTSYSDVVSERAVNPDKRRNLIKNEGPRHYIDLDRYAPSKRCCLPRNWKDAVLLYSTDSLYNNGVVPWHTISVYNQLVNAFAKRNKEQILKISADIGHYISDAHVPLHSTENYDGQLTNQKGIHSFWESRLPELFGNNYNFIVGKAVYLENPSEQMWAIVQASFIAVDSVLSFEKELTLAMPDKKYEPNPKNPSKTQVTEAFSKAYHDKLNGQVERRMRASIQEVANFWYSAWVDAGQPKLDMLRSETLTPEQLEAAETEYQDWLLRTYAQEADSCMKPIFKK